MQLNDRRLRAKIRHLRHKGKRLREDGQRHQYTIDELKKRFGISGTSITSILDNAHGDNLSLDIRYLRRDDGPAMQAASKREEETRILEKYKGPTPHRHAGQRVSRFDSFLYLVRSYVRQCNRQA